MVFQLLSFAHRAGFNDFDGVKIGLHLAKLGSPPKKGVNFPSENPLWGAPRKMVPANNFPVCCQNLTFCRRALPKSILRISPRMANSAEIAGAQCPQTIKNTPRLGTLLRSGWDPQFPLSKTPVRRGCAIFFGTQIFKKLPLPS